MFDMKDEEYEVLQKEFIYILKNMEAINKIEGIEQITPMTHPFIMTDVFFNDDKVKDCLKTEEVLQNAKEMENNEIKVPKVVG